MRDVIYFYLLLEQFKTHFFQYCFYTEILRAIQFAQLTE